MIIVPFPDNLIIQGVVQEIDSHYLEEFELGVVHGQETDVIVRHLQPWSPGLGGIQLLEGLLHDIKGVRIFKLVSKHNLFMRQGGQIGVAASVRPGHFVRAAGERKQGYP